jgi:hypothetical protein
MGDELIFFKMVKTTNQLWEVFFPGRWLADDVFFFPVG